MTARIFDKPTSLLAELAQPGAPPFGIQDAHSGRVVIWIDASLEDRLRLQEVLFPQGLVWDGAGFEPRSRG